jgi:hypothetical protein
MRKWKDTSVYAKFVLEVKSQQIKIDIVERERSQT